MNDSRSKTSARLLDYVLVVRKPGSTVVPQSRKEVSHQIKPSHRRTTSDPLKQNSATSLAQDGIDWTEKLPLNIGRRDSETSVAKRYAGLRDGEGSVSDDNSDSDDDDEGFPAKFSSSRAKLRSRTSKHLSNRVHSMEIMSEEDSNEDSGLDEEDIRNSGSVESNLGSSSSTDLPNGNETNCSEDARSGDDVEVDGGGRSQRSGSNDGDGKGAGDVDRCNILIFPGQDGVPPFLQQVHTLCFPMEGGVSRHSSKRRFIAFVLTDIDGTFWYGYSLAFGALQGGERKALVFVSRYFIMESAKKLLIDVTALAESTTSSVVLKALSALACYSIPSPPTCTLRINLWPGRSKPIEVPDLDRRSLWYLFVALSPRTIIVLWKAMLLEGQVLLLSRRGLSFLTAAAEALRQLCLPIQFEGVFVPVLPRELTPYLEAPTPYLMGTNPDQVDLKELDLGDTLICNLDIDTLEGNKSLPPLQNDREAFLEKQLALQRFPHIHNLDAAPDIDPTDTGILFAAASSLLSSAVRELVETLQFAQRRTKSGVARPPLDPFSLALLDTQGFRGTLEDRDGNDVPFAMGNFDRLIHHDRATIDLAVTVDNPGRSAEAATPVTSSLTSISETESSATPTSLSIRRLTHAEESFAGLTPAPFFGTREQQDRQLQVPDDIDLHITPQPGGDGGASSVNPQQPLAGDSGDGSTRGNVAIDSIEDALRMLQEAPDESFSVNVFQRQARDFADDMKAAARPPVEEGDGGHDDEAINKGKYFAGRSNDVPEGFGVAGSQEDASSTGADLLLLASAAVARAFCLQNEASRKALQKGVTDSKSDQSDVGSSGGDDIISLLEGALDCYEEASLLDTRAVPEMNVRQLLHAMASKGRLSDSQGRRVRHILMRMAGSCDVDQAMDTPTGAVNGDSAGLSAVVPATNQLPGTQDNGSTSDGRWVEWDHTNATPRAPLLKGKNRTLNSHVKWVGEARDPSTVVVTLLEELIAIVEQAADEPAGQKSRLRMTSQSEQPSYMTVPRGKTLRVARDSPQFMAFERHTAELQVVRPDTLVGDEKIMFWLNLHNLMTLHAIVTDLSTDGFNPTRFSLLRSFSLLGYVVAGIRISKVEVEHAVLRGRSSRPSYFASALWTPKWATKDPRYLLIPHLEGEALKLISFGMFHGTASSPPLFVFERPNALISDLRSCARSYLMETVSLMRSQVVTTVRLPKYFQWFSADFKGNDRVILEFVHDVGGVTEIGTLLEAGRPIVIRYLTYSFNVQARVDVSSCRKLPPMAGSRRDSGTVGLGRLSSLSSSSNNDITDVDGNRRDSMHPYQLFPSEETL